MRRFCLPQRGIERREGRVEEKLRRLSAPFMFSVCVVKIHLLWNQGLMSGVQEC